MVFVVELKMMVSVILRLKGKILGFYVLSKKLSKLIAMANFGYPKNAPSYKARAKNKFFEKKNAIL